LIRFANPIAASSCIAFKQLVRTSTDSA
jgi:hypothetical protein